MLWQKLKEAHVKDPSDRFSLLEELLKGTSFSDNDKILIDEIVAIGTKCERLILKNAGFMEGGTLRDEVLPRAANHYKILQLVHAGKLKGEPIRFSDMTFQAGTLDGEINQKIQSLETDLGRLRKQVTLWGWIKSLFAF